VSGLVEVLSLALLLAGAGLCLLGAVGVLRLPSLASRLQAATKPQTLGLLLVLVGTALRVPLASAATLLLVALFQIVTAPVISQLVGRSAYHSGTWRPEVIVVDELAERLGDRGCERGGR
jgi:multicomponent Na+:H+ antiporter subunit G